MYKLFLGTQSSRFTLNVAGRPIGHLRGNELPGIAIFGTSGYSLSDSLDNSISRFLSDFQDDSDDEGLLF